MVFPETSAIGHAVESKKAWRRVLNRAGIDSLRIHNLRRTLGSWQAKTGASLAIWVNPLIINLTVPRRFMPDWI